MSTVAPPAARLRRTVAGAAVVAAAALVLTACGGGESGGGEAGQASARTLTVSAAASLTEVYEQLGQSFRTENPGVTVRFNFGGSDTLAQQIVQGAPADVLATASTRTMQTAVTGGKIAGEPTVYATNRLQIAVRPGNPENIASLADVARPDVSEVVCAPAVPCGAATEAAERAAGVTLTPVSEEQDVRDVLQRVVTSNADAGLVYVTDVASVDGQVEGVDFPQATAQGATQSYPIAVVNGSQNQDLAAQWISYVTGEQGRAALGRAGFAVR